jgi:hypothetical protein
VEAPLAALLAGSLRRRAAATLSVFLNLASHPLGYLIVRRGLCSWGGVELTVTALEALGYASILRIRWRHALLMSLVCNAATAGLSLIIGPTG